ncbi:outer membrane protein assembly factor BamE [Pseudooceanicola aestuarii]|uniref:outer membrane protein assembly factor BamE n=1 Tax=Pseudooceanicola aestuarii TaxID=2697319 RepID=UPI0013D3E80D|nr:outer membrane protein assembly factor BamE [Pseudooceanicola aestuarii]
MGQLGIRGARGALILLVALTLTACTAQYRNHGYLPPEDDVQTVELGEDRDSVLEKLGTPATSGVLEDSSLYYVRSRVKRYAFFRPEVVEREVVAVSFTPAGQVSNVERFGLEDGKVVPIARRVTSSSTANKGFLRQLLGNLGRFSAENVLGG